MEKDAKDENRFPMAVRNHVQRCIRWTLCARVLEQTTSGGADRNASVACTVTD